MASLGLFVLAAALTASLAHPGPPMVAMSVEDAKPVNVTLYYESLCPGCHEFVTQTLYPTWKLASGSNLMTITMLPFGNAEERHEGFGWKFYCQHGPQECQGNIVEACIIHYYPKLDKQLEIINCFEDNFFKSMGADWEKTLKKCASTGVDVQAITKCMNGNEGHDLEHIVASKTGPHNEVPYVLLDGRHDEAALSFFLREVCNAYKGTPPKVCT